MTRLISGRVEKVDSANVSVDRYEYLRLEEAEPDLGLPSSLGQVFTSDLSGGRTWITLDTANVNETGNLYYTNDRVEAFLQSSVFKNDVTLYSNLEIYGDLVVQGNTVTLNTATLIVEDKNIFLANGATNAAAADGSGITIDGADANLIYTSSSDRFVFNKIVEANIAGTVSQLINHTTSNLLEGNNFYYTNTRVATAVTPILTTSNVVELGNLYFTNTRAILALDGANVYVGNLIAHDIIQGNTLVIRGINVSDDSLVGNIQATGITGNTLRIEDVFAVGVRADFITSNTWNRLYSSNVIEYDNLFYTNSRVVSAVTPLLVTSNVIEGDNLYYTNTRVVSAVTPLLVTSNVIEGDNLYYTNTRVVSAVTPLLVTSNVIEGDNLYYTNTRVKTYVESLPITLNGNTTTDLAEGDNLYYTNARVKTYVESLPITLNGNTTTDLAEGDNLYYTNARVKTYVDTLPIDLSGNTTSDLAEGDNLYYTNARVKTFVESLPIDLSGNTTSDLAEGDNLYYTNTRVVSAVTPLLVTSNVIEGDNLYYTNARVKTYVQSLPIDLSGNTSSDLAEGDNLYYTNARVLTAVNPRLTTANVTELDNLYYTNARVDAYINDSITTDDITEGLNLYYTNTRVLSHIAASDIETLNLTVDGNLVVVGNLSYLQVQNLEISDNMVYLNANSNISNPDLGWAGNYNDGTYAHTGVFRDASDGVFKFFEGYTPEPDESPYINTAHASFRFANVQAERFIGTISTLSNHTTSNLAEGVNLYYTNSRVKTFVESLPIDLSGNTTTDLSEGNNLYYTNARVDSRVAELSINVLADVDISNISDGQTIVWDADNSTFIVTTLSQAAAANVAQFSFASNIANVVTTLNNFTTSNLSEGVNLYYTNTRVVSAVTPLLVTSNVLEGDNLYYTNTRVVSAVTPLLVTSNVLEGDNLYYTNARVKTYVESLPITLNGNTTSDLTEGNNLYYTNTRVLSHLEVSDVVIANLTVTGEITGVGNIAALTANVANLSTQVENLENLTTDELAEGEVNKYFSNSLARGAFTAGRGIRITLDGEISSIDDSELYNVYLQDSIGYMVSNTMSSALSLPASPVNERYMLHSIHVTNITDNDVKISGNILYADGNTALFSNKFVVPTGSSLEFQKRTQILSPGDKINLQGFDSSGSAVNDALSAIITYEPIDNDPKFFGIGKEIREAGDVLVFDGEESSTILESIKLVNLENSIQRCKVLWTDANTLTKGYFAYNVSLPPHSSVEVLGTHKRLAIGDLLYANCTTSGNVSVFVSGKRTSVFQIIGVSSVVEPADTIEVSIQMPDNTFEGQTLFYNIE